jgi:NAD(P)-dependent dehydrogenase (short-subunit alcohol dehydrogenase family)
MSLAAPSIAVLGLQDRRVLVTGASGTIGRAIAVAFGAEGARVAVAYHNRAEQAEQVAADVAAEGGTAVTLRLDLADYSSISGAMAARPLLPGLSLRRRSQ